jgi:phospholipase C
VTTPGIARGTIGASFGSHLSLENAVKLKLYAAAGGTMAAAAVAIGTALGLGGASADPSADAATKTPIKHVVVLFDENESFDHYFGTYPHAANNDPGGADFTAKPGTPPVDGLTSTLLTANPNSLNPVRLTHAQAVTCSQNHAYAPEQKAVDNGLMDKFPENTAGGSCASNIVMDYFDGNTVTGLWNLAQSFALNDNSYSSTYGPSTVGALNLISGQTHGATPTSIANTTENGTVIGDPDPSTTLDDCATGTTTMSGRNVGDLLNTKGVSWGWFQGGFRPDAGTGTGGVRATCTATHTNVAGGSSKDYSPHHAPFEYYASTSNLHHTPPASVDEIGHAGQANHQYDLTDFDTALAAGKLPAVSFVKAAQFEDAHPGNSDRSTSSASSPARSTRWRPHRSGPPRPSSSPTTTPTAGMTTSCPTSSTRRRRRRTASPPTASAARSPIPRPTRTAAAWVSASRCWSSRPTPSRTSSTTRSPSRRRS